MLSFAWSWTGSHRLAQCKCRHYYRKHDCSKTAREMILVLPNCRARANDTYVADQFLLDNYRAFDNFINDLRDNLMPYIKENYSVAEGR